MVSGRYCCLIRQDSCVDTSACYLFEVFRLGINGMTDRSISIHPNPASKVLSIQPASNYSYELYDLIGRKVSYGVAKSEIDVSGVKEGVYILSLKDQKGNAWMEKLEVRR